MPTRSLLVAALSACTTVAAASGQAGATATAPGPSYECGKVEAGSIERTICQDEALVTWGYETPEMKCRRVQ